MSHPEDRAWYWQAGGRSLGDTPPALPPYPGVGGTTTKASLQFPSPNCFLPRVGTRNSRLPLLCLSRVSARAGKGALEDWEERATVTATATLDAGQGAVTEVTLGSVLFFSSTLDPQPCKLWGIVRDQEVGLSSCFA